MDIALTGASGLIGRALSRRLTMLGHTVRPISRSPGPDVITWDVAAGRLDSQALEGIDGFVHLAGEPIAARRWNEEQKTRIEQSRVDGTTLVATTLAGMSRPPRVLVSGSAIGVYGDRGDEELTESSAAGDGFLAEVCLEWETATASAEQAGIRVAHVRTGMVLAEGDGALAKQIPLFKFGIGGKLGSGRQWWSWISIDDAAQAIIWLLEHDIAGPVNLTAPNPCTQADFADALGRALRRPTFLPTPAFGPKLVLGAELADNLLFTSARVLPNVLVESGYRFIHPTLEEGLRDLLDRPGQVA